jgi:hypothetical protein
VDRDVRGFMIFVCILFGGMFAGIGIEQYQKNTCRVEAMKAQMPVDDIVKVCGK